MNGNNINGYSQRDLFGGRDDIQEGDEYDYGVGWENNYGLKWDNNYGFGWNRNESGGLVKTNTPVATYAVKVKEAVDIEKCTKAVVGTTEVFIASSGQLFVIAEDIMGGRVVRKFKDLDIAVPSRGTEFKGKVLEVPGKEWVVTRDLLIKWGRELAKYDTEVGGVKGRKVEEDGEVKFLLCIPQQEVSGASVDGDHWNEAAEYLMQRGYTPIGTLHTHPGDMACKSGVDETAWEKFGGVHTIITKAGTMVEYYSCGGIVSDIIHKEDNLWVGKSEGTHKKCKGIISYTGSKEYWMGIKKKVYGAVVVGGNKGYVPYEKGMVWDFQKQEWKWPGADKTEDSVMVPSDKVGELFEIQEGVYAARRSDGMYDLRDKWGNRYGVVEKKALGFLGKNLTEDNEQGVKEGKGGSSRYIMDYDQRASDAISTLQGPEVMANVEYLDRKGQMTCMDSLDIMTEVKVVKKPVRNVVTDIKGSDLVWYCRDDVAYEVLEEGYNAGLLGFVAPIDKKYLDTLGYGDGEEDLLNTQVLSRVMVTGGKVAIGIRKVGEFEAKKGPVRASLDKAQEHLRQARIELTEAIVTVERLKAEKVLMAGYGNVEPISMEYTLTGQVFVSDVEILKSLCFLIKEIEG